MRIRVCTAIFGPVVPSSLPELQKPQRHCFDFLASSVISEATLLAIAWLASLKLSLGEGTSFQFWSWADPVEREVGKTHPSVTMRSAVTASCWANGFGC